MGYIRRGTRIILQKRERKIARFSIFMSSSVGRGSLIVSRDFTREAPRETRIIGMATAPAVSIARNKELWRNDVVLKNSSCWRGVITATMIDARTAHNGGFIRLIM